MKEIIGRIIAGILYAIVYFGAFILGLIFFILMFTVVPCIIFDLTGGAIP